MKIITCQHFDLSIKFIKSIGFKQSSSDPWLLFRIEKGEYTLTTLVVDDLLLATITTLQADAIINKLKTQFRIKDLEKPDYTIGMHITYDRKAYRLLLNLQSIVVLDKKTPKLRSRRPIAASS